MATPVEPTLSPIDQLAIQMADWVSENVTGLSQREAEGLEEEFKRLVSLWEAQLVKRELARLGPGAQLQHIVTYPPSRQEPFTIPQPSIDS